MLVAMIISVVWVSFMVFAIECYKNTAKDPTLDQIAQEFCYENHFKFIDVIPITGYKTYVDTLGKNKWTEYYFNPVGSSEAFWADYMIDLNLDTIFVVRYQDRALNDFVSIIH